MATPASRYLYQVQTFVSGSEAAHMEAALQTARTCEESKAPYPEQIRAMVRRAYALLEIDAPEVAAEFGPPELD